MKRRHNILLSVIRHASPGIHRPAAHVAPRPARHAIFHPAPLSAPRPASLVVFRSLVDAVLRNLLRPIAFGLFLLTTCSSQLEAQSYWQQQVDYTIEVSLNDTEHTLDGFLKLQYHNNSPDTLSFIWIHLWPNAYKNDRTALSDQLLANGKTDFYFSDKEKKGYINRLDFRVNGEEAKMEDHPQYIDIIRILLPHPLLPGSQATITTPFHEQLPFNFSRGGHKGRTYQVTQWYPKPAVYDREGWHPIPYLDQGEFYSEFGNYDVRITVPKRYVVAATGQGTDSTGQPLNSLPAAATDQPLITLHYRQDRVHDFAWFANAHYRTDHDTLRLPSGRIIDVYAHYTPGSTPVWQNAIRYIKDAVLFRSALIGEYPFNTVAAAEIDMGNPGGMEYPTITGITRQSNGRSLDLVIEHEVGHNWFYGILATNERRYPWMDEGINTYYDRRYEAAKYDNRLSPVTIGLNPTPPAARIATPPANPKPQLKKTAHQPQTRIRSRRITETNKDIVPEVNPKPETRNPKPETAKIAPQPAWLLKKLPEDPDRLFVDILAKERRDQPISTSSGDFTPTNYDYIAYTKTGLWMKALEDSLGTPLFDSCMREYFRRWQFRHPYPEDFRSVITTTGGQSLDTLFAMLNEKGPIPPFAVNRKIRPTILFNFHNTDKIDYINILPAIGYNKYDQFMIGALVHNFNLPPDNFRFLVAPLYATGSHQLNGLGRVGYTWYPGSHFQKIELYLAGDRFSTLSGTDSNGHKLFGGFYKLAPSIRFTFSNPSARSTMEKWIEWKTYLIGEKNFGNYVIKSTDSNYYPTAGAYAFRYLNQLSFSLQDSRVLYPYRLLVQVQQAAQFYRVNLTGNYFFNYSHGGGMDVRFFAAKFGLIGSNSSAAALSTFEPKLTAVRGNEDYTYSNYFAGRNEFTGFSSQQIMLRDGDLKLRTDLFQGLQGRSANWVSSMNFNSTLPTAIVPRWLPLKVFLDVGTYAEAWQSNPPTNRFLYVGGLQLSLFKNALNFYAPLFYSSDFGNQLKTVSEENTFWKKISFSIDIQNVSLHKIFGNIPL